MGGAGADRRQVVLCRVDVNRVCGRAAQLTSQGILLLSRNSPGGSPRSRAASDASCSSGTYRTYQLLLFVVVVVLLLLALLEVAGAGSCVLPGAGKKGCVPPLCGQAGKREQTDRSGKVELWHTERCACQVSTHRQQRHQCQGLATQQFLPQTCTGWCPDTQPTQHTLCG